MTDREFLRVHLEACWGINVPPLDGELIELAPTDLQPPWSIYTAHLASDTVVVLRAGIAEADQSDLFRQSVSFEAGFDPALRMRREIVLKLRNGVPPSLPNPHAVRLLTEEDVALIEVFEADSASYFLDAQRGPCFGVVVDGQLVSVAHSSRRTAVACALGINTLPSARRRGYALAATVVWTQAALREGLTPIYSALATNTASLGLAAKTGYTHVIEGVYGPILEADG